MKVGALGAVGLYVCFWVGVSDCALVEDHYAALDASLFCYLVCMFPEGFEGGG